MLDRLVALFAVRPKTAEGWLARMGRPDVGARDEAGLLEWLSADPDHLRQYQQAKADHAALEALRGEFAVDLMRLRRAGRPPAAARRLVLAGGLVAAAVAGAAVLGPSLWGRADVRRFESPAGRIVDVTLDDGSRITLDAGSAVRVALAPEARRVTLERGAAYFEVVHDADRPFQVGVGDRRVIVTGTRFVTALTGDGAAVSLLEGAVSIGRRDVAERSPFEGALRLAPGERAVFRPGRPGVLKAAADVDTATAWRRRRLIFQDASLAEVVAAAARYSEAPLVVADPALERLRVTVVLPLEGDGPLADRLAALLPVRTERTADGRILVRAEPAHRRAVTPVR